MTLDAQRRETLLKTVRARDFRRALHAIAELRADDGPALAGVVAGFRPLDAQRAVQYEIARVVLARGVRGLVDAWPLPADAARRAQLVSEIGQFLALWAEEALVDLVLAALEDASLDVRVNAARVMPALVGREAKRERPTSESHRRALAAIDTLRACMTPARRQRAARAVLAMLEEHHRTRSIVLPQLVEILGRTAPANDTAALAALEALRGQSGEPHHVSFERLDESTLGWAERLVAARKGIAPERLAMRIAYRGTGLLDQKILLTALRRLQGLSE